MFNHQNATARLLPLLIVALVFIGFWADRASAEDCKKTVVSLRGDYEVLQADGGLWRFMEKSTWLRPNSMIGFQIDTKIQRVVSFLEGKCSDGKEIPPELLKGLLQGMDDARSINNKSTERTPAKKLLEMLTALNKDLTQLLDSNGL